MQVYPLDKPSEFGVHPHSPAVAGFPDSGLLTFFGELNLIRATSGVNAEINGSSSVGVVPGTIGAFYLAYLNVVPCSFYVPVQLPHGATALSLTIVIMGSPQALSLHFI